jgi:tRNA pseudouridine55 synthase
MNGIINVLKPPGMTSHDVVNFIRRLSGQKKVGHTGTLDPGAAGVLPVCLGKATRIIQYLPGDKSYRAEVAFGLTTTTQDAFGDVVGTAGAGSLTVNDVEHCLQYFAGRIEQVPPMTSAIKYRGKKLYELARAGIEVERKPRAVYIYKIALVDFYHDRSGLPRALIDIHCSAGTYVRTVCHDVGEKLGCGAYMSFLLRTRAGNFKLEDSVTLEYLKELLDAGSLENALIPVQRALEHLPRVFLEENFASAVQHGNSIILPGAAVENKLSAGQMACLEGHEGLLALARVGHDVDKPGHYIIQPVKVLV